ncbi:ankyrin repeat-containing protein ITN1-like [Pyrus communis]|uniref:ankyrin repeat-containing protein ITN1-like n=1 Tax=Pyrus communis TaxID=23211 RepID=UPI0035C0B209
MTAQPNQNSLAEPSPPPSPSSTTRGRSKQVTGRHNDTELHLAAQRADLAAVKKILGDIDSQIVGAVSGAEFDTEVAEVRAAVVNEVNELGETALFTAADKGHLDVVKELLKYSNREIVTKKNRSGFDKFALVFLCWIPSWSPDEEGLQKFQAEVEEEEEKEQCSPVSVLDPPFQDDDEGHDDEDGFDLKCSYANVLRTKHHLLLKRRRFEQLAGLDPIELEKRMLEEEDGDDDECENIQLRVFKSLQHPAA